MVIQRWHRKALILCGALLAAVLQFFGATAWASIVVDPSFFTGSRTTVGTTGSGGGLIWNPPAGNWSNGNISIQWTITDNGTDFTYKYTVNSPDNATLSHWILALSPVDANGQSLDAHWAAVITGEEPPIPTNPTAGNPGIPAGGIPYGVRFPADSTMEMVQFTTPQVPIWGDFYAKDGGGTGADAVFAYNAGFGTDPDPAGPFLNWIPRPDGVRRPPVGGNVPEPWSFVVWSLLLGCVGAMTSRRPKSAA